MSVHPWHDVPLSDDPTIWFPVYIEIPKGSRVKYELDKGTGHLKIDRPQKYSNVCPTLYGLIPQTFCGDRVADACRERVSAAECAVSDRAAYIAIAMGAWPEESEKDACRGISS